VAAHHITLKLNEEHTVEWHTILAQSFEISLNPNSFFPDDETWDLGCNIGGLFLPFC